MKALQYIYTSWENGGSQTKGYMIYSKSNGIADDECEDIRRIMQYRPPMSLVPNPTPEQIVDEFPYSFAYFALGSGRCCVALSTYLGKDYSNRYGNYIIYALVLEPSEVDCYPVEFFGEDFLKTYMTDEELNAESPVPPLPPLEIDTVGNMINEDAIIDFASDHEEQIIQLIDALIEARSTKVPIFLNDSRENLAMWCAIVQELFPIEVAKEIYFTTYAFDQNNVMKCMSEYGRRMTVIGVWPGGNGFNYATEIHNAGKIVIDFANGYVTDNIKSNIVSRELAADFTLGMDEIRRFGEFIAGLNDPTDLPLNAAYVYYKLLRYNSLETEPELLDELLQFAVKYGHQEDNRQIASNLLDLYTSGRVLSDTKEASTLLDFLYKNVDYMLFSIHELFLNVLNGTADVSGTEAKKLYDMVKINSPAAHRSFAEYFVTDEIIRRYTDILSRNNKRDINLFYGELLLDINAERNVPDEVGRSERLLHIIVKNLAGGNSVERDCATLFSQSVRTPRLLGTIVSDFNSNLDNNNKEGFYNAFLQFLVSQKDADAEKTFMSLISNPRTADVCVYVYSKVIADSKDGENYFWDFINRLNKQGVAGKVDISRLVEAYLKGDKKASVGLGIIERLDFHWILSSEVRRDVIRRVEESTIKELKNLRYSIIDKVLQLAGMDGIEREIPKISAVAVGRRANGEDSRRYRSYSEVEQGLEFSLFNLDPKDYEQFLTEYLEPMVILVRTADEMGMLITACYNKSRFGLFDNIFTGTLKKLQKKKQDMWMDRLDHVSVWLIDNSSKDEVAEKFQSYFIQYLRKQDDKDIMELEKLVRQHVPQGREMRFFDEIQKKESFKDKVGNVFKRKM